MFESCRAHFRRKSARFAGMTTFAGSTASSEVWWARSGKARLRRGLQEGGFDRCRDVLRGFQLRVVTDVVERDDAEARNSLAGVVGDVGA
jgi:hypothetical protein